MRSLVVRTRHYRRRPCTGMIVLPIAVHETRMESRWQEPAYIPEQEDHYAALGRMLKRLCRTEVP
jgi:hypothetical protein